MSERLAPVDEYGMPYAIHPFDPESDQKNAFKVGGEVWFDEDHAFYCEAAEALQSDVGKALRYSRVHVVQRWLHEKKHSMFMGGIEKFPETEADTFGLLVLSCAGYLPKKALDLRIKNRFNFVEMDDITYEWVRGRHHLHLQTDRNSRIPSGGPNSKRTQDDAKRNIGAYLLDYAKRQDLSHLQGTDFVDEFLSTHDELRRFELGRIILDEAVRVAVDPVSGKYKKALEKGLIRPNKADPVAVLRRFGYVGQFAEHVSDLEHVLQAA